MKVLVIYFSQTGNTEKIALAIHEETLKDHSSHLKKTQEVKVSEIEKYDLIFLGSACHSTDLGTPVKILLENLPHSPRFKLAGFFTHATMSNGEAFENWAGKCILSFERTCKEKEIDFKGCYHCQGAPSPPIEEFIHREIIKDEQEWEKYLEEVRKHPTSQDLQKARSFAREVLSKT